jgi:hypothetical protein
MAEPPTRPESDRRPVASESHNNTPNVQEAGTDTAQPLTLPPLTGATRAEETTAPEARRPAVKTFARYHLLEQLPPSGMGIVYKARDPLLDIDVALKTMQSPLADEGHQSIERFLNDARALAKLDHPHIVRVYDVDEHDGRAYFTMGYMTGGSLDRHIDRFREPRAAAALVEKVARAMQYVHDHGIIHRDLKPGNILLDEHGEPRVTDFGLAKFRDNEKMDVTPQGAVLGTIPYMAPEQASGSVDEISPATDVWALGVILYELLTGRRPFDAKTREALTSQICTSQPPRPARLRPGLQQPLETITLKCLEKRREDRYATASALADDLGRWLAGESILARPAPLRERLRRFVRRHAAACAVTALLVVLLALAPFAGSGILSARQEHRVRQVKEENLREVREELARGQAVRLIRPAGRPQWYERRLGTPDVVHLRGVKPEGLQLMNYQAVALDLVPESPAPGYRLSAEILITKESGQDTDCGIYIAGTGWPDAAGRREEWFLSLAVLRGPVDPSLRSVDPTRVPAEPVVTCELHRYFERSILDSEHTYKFCHHALPKGGGFLGVPWRLRLDVTPETILPFFNGKQIATIGRRDLEKALRILSNPRLLPKSDGPPPADTLLHGGLGLYNRNATALFHDVVVEPLP